MADDGYGTASIQAAGAISAAAVSNSGSRKSQERANEMNLDFWRKQNEYNNPQAQMERLRKAGLNPALIYGTSPTSAVGNAESITPSKASPYEMPNPVGNITAFADLKQREAQTDLLKAQNTTQEQQSILTAQQAKLSAANAGMAEQQLGINPDLIKASLQAAQENVRQMEAGTIGKTLDNQFKTGALKDQLKEMTYRAEYAKKNMEGQELLNELRRLEINLNKLGIQKTDSAWMRILGQKYEELKRAYKKWAPKTI